MVDTIIFFITIVEINIDNKKHVVKNIIKIKYW